MKIRIAFFLIVWLAGGIVFALKSETPAPSPYADVRIKKFPFAVQCWTYREYTFFETLAKVKALGIECVQAYPGQALGSEIPGVKFDHNLKDEQIAVVQKKLNENGLRLVAYGVVGFPADEAGMRQVFDFARKLGIGTIVSEPEFDDWSLLDRLAREYHIRVAVHNHAEPAKYAWPETVLDHLRNCSEWIGACADTGHWLRTGVQPVEALQQLDGHILDVHLKDLNKFGNLKAVDVPFGQGRANVRDILAELTLQDYQGYLTIEHENPKEALKPESAILKGIAYVKSVTYYQDYEQILKSANGRYEKHGWNHYGPGYFELDEKSGVLKSQGGMGLLWYSVRKYRDFILELDFKCSHNNTNSGVFVRVPELPSSDDYIYHSFEIQIYDAGEGIHKTGAAYDAEAPRLDAAKPSGEWNHFKITFLGKHLQVELNGQLILDWEAEPRGKVKDFASEGYIGLQNHDSISPVFFRRIYVKELK